MKARQSPHPYDTLQTALRSAFPVDARRLEVLAALILAMEHLFARFALSFLPVGELHLILDRTNWKLGSQDVNILLLSAVWDDFSLPLMWELLPHGGGSSQQVREALRARFLRCYPARPVRSLLADREFIGKSRFTFLDQHSIAPCIRLPATATVGTSKFPVWACFKKPRQAKFVGGTALWSSMACPCTCVPRRMPLERCCTWRTGAYGRVVQSWSASW